MVRSLSFMQLYLKKMIKNYNRDTNAIGTQLFVVYSIYRLNPAIFGFTTNNSEKTPG